MSPTHPAPLARPAIRRPRRASEPLPDGRRLGAHLPLGGGMVRAVDRARAIGADALQVFADNPTAWRRRTDPPRELPAFRARLELHGIRPVAIHASYLVNLAGPEEDFYERSIGVLAEELRVAPSFGARFVNVHVGSHKGAGIAAGTERVAEGVARALAEAEERSVEPFAAADAAESAPILVLENSAGGGFGIGVTVEELANVLDAIAARGVDSDRIGFCLDAAHLWGAGYRISESDETDALLAAFDGRIGLARLAMIHLNDSKAGLGSRLDRHEHLGAGAIGEAGLRHLLTHPLLAHVAYFLETPGMDEGYDKINLGRARDIAAGRPLRRLPARAMNVRGSRARTAPTAEPALDEDIEGEARLEAV